MDIIQNLFNESIKKGISFPIVGSKIISKKLKDKGIDLDEEQINKIRKILEKVKDDRFSFTLDIDDAILNKLGFKDTESISLDIGDSEEEINQIYKEFSDKIPEIITDISQEISNLLLSSLKNKASKMLKQDKKDFKGFYKRFHKNWKKPLEIFKFYLILAIDVGSDFNKEYRDEAVKTNNYVFEVVTRLHARACQITNEIFILIQNGYADGAYARWRTLHEVNVISRFIQRNGNEVAEKYLLHDNIESYKSAVLFQKHYKELGYEPISEEELITLTDTYNKLIQRFGEDYKNEYGWAASALKKKQPNFSQIEENVGFDYLRPYYKLASHNVHANPKGIIFKMGLFPEHPNILLTGPSNTGFTDPAQGAIISLGQITALLLLIFPTIDHLVIINILRNLESEIIDSFFRVQTMIEDREKKKRENTFSP